MPIRSVRPALLVALCSVSACHRTGVTGQSAQTETGGFVITLGADTVHVERFSRTKERLEGTIITRSPETRVMKYSLAFAPDGVPVRYEYSTARADGTPLRGASQAGAVAFGSDSVTREVLNRDGQMVTERVVARPGILPGPNLPYIGTPALFYEMGFESARKTASAAGESTLPQLIMIAGANRPSGTRVWFVGSDSVEMDYFGVARRGFRLDTKGQLVRADWSNATYKYQFRRTGDIDVAAIASAWSARDKAGAAMGAMSPQDTVRGKVGTSDVMITYSRPSKRGRAIWGGLVPWNAVWRFGADFATHINTTADLMIGTTLVPTGRYTLWMLPSEQGSMLIVNKQVNIFGTAYNPANDFARIPLSREELRGPVERFTLQIADGRFMIWWDQTGWSVPIAMK